MDTLFISGLKLNTRIGVYPWEHHVPQTIIIDLEMKTEIRTAASSCDLTDTIDYAALSERLQDFVAEKHFKLIETLSEDIAHFILTHFPTRHLRLKLNKISALSKADGVGLIIERSAV